MKSSEGKPVIFGHLGKRADFIGERLANVYGKVPDAARVIAKSVGVMYAVGGGFKRGAASEDHATWLWSTGYVPTSENEVVEDFDHISLEVDAKNAVLSGSQSGTLPLYLVESKDGLTFSSNLDLLIKSKNTPLKPDYVGLGEMVAASGPFNGRTTVAGIQRVQPGEVFHVDTAGAIKRENKWLWPGITPNGGKVGAVREALWEHIRTVTRGQDVVSMLSGGWDSRLLLAAAFHIGMPTSVAGYTTSSDTGTVMEELVAAQVANHLNIDHHIAFPERSHFPTDFREFGAAVDYQTAFHVWLMPLLRAVKNQYTGNDTDQPRPVALDGLGGGLFIGSSFSDEGRSNDVKEGRLRGITRYLNRESNVLRPEVANNIREQIRAEAEPIIDDFLKHPYGHTLSAYVARTLPGISHAPHSLISETANIATPFVASSVVEAALQMPVTAHRDDQLYGQLLNEIDPFLARLTTAQEQVPWPRPHPRRITAIEVVHELRKLVNAEPVKQLVKKEFLRATDEEWQRALAKTADQHIIRGLAMLSLWHERYREFFSSFDLGSVYR